MICIFDFCLKKKKEALKLRLLFWRRRRDPRATLSLLSNLYILAPLLRNRRKWISKSSNLLSVKKKKEALIIKTSSLAQKERFELSRRFPGLRP